jgi:hypothetical protein
VSEPNTLLLRETGVARLADGREAVNVGPIVSALAFLTEGRGEDRGTDENGEPLPDLLSLAFDVVKSIILGGRHADYFRQVKVDFDAQSDAGGHTSLALAKQASAVRRPTPEVSLPDDALSEAATELQARLQKLRESASQLVLELESLDGIEPRRVPKRRKAKAKPKPKPQAKVAKGKVTNSKKKKAKARKA